MEDQKDSQANSKFYSNPEDELLELMNGYMTTQLIYVMAEFRIADLLKDTPRTSEELSQLANLNLRKLRQVLRGLVYIGLLEQQTDGKFTLTPKGQYLQGGISNSLRLRAVEIGKINYNVWANLKFGLETGENLFEKTLGTNYFDFLNQDFITSIGFHNSMIRIAKETAPAIVAAYNFSDYKKVIDVGGGGGILITEILKKSPFVYGVLYEKDDTVLKRAKDYLKDANVEDRCEIVQGDFFTEVPSNGDLYILSWIIHDWDDQKAINILKNVRKAMLPETRLLVIEQLMPEHVQKPNIFLKLDVIRSNLAMLGLTDGCERTTSEYAELFQAADLSMVRVINTETFRSIIEVSLL